MSKETFPIRWRGKTSGPHDIDALRNMLEKGDVSLMHEISLDGRWISLEEFLAQRPKRAPAPVVVVQKPVQPPEPLGPPPVPLEEQYYLAQDGKKEGPYSVSRLRELANAEIIVPTDLVWKEGLASWQQLSAVLGPSITTRTRIIDRTEPPPDQGRHGPDSESPTQPHRWELFARCWVF
ncbi:MAG: DUF4339 domain-containing protein [Chthoniobacterales bacterium]|nr:DUF4339 domain-containing protein [Chthoniobacterales bacterium]